MYFFFNFIEGTRSILSFPPFLFLSQSPGGTFQKLSSDTIFTACSHKFTLLIEKDVCDRQNILNKFPCVCVCHSSGDLLNFLYEFSLILCYSHFDTFLSMWSFKYYNLLIEVESWFASISADFYEYGIKISFTDVNRMWQ